MANDKLIMKNTMFMAVRMLFYLGVTFYTSRVVLQQLGVDNFGIYNVVGGLTLLMAFFTSALTAAIQRYMNVSLARDGSDADMQRVFSACWGCVITMTVVFIIFAEIVGLWFLDTYLNIPAERMPVARNVFQMSLVIVVMEMLRVPYNSLIIAHERMSFYAWNSIVEISLRLATAISLGLIAGDKLIVYMWLLIAVALLVNLSYIIYCRHTFPAIHFSLSADRHQVWEIGKFAGWNVLTSLSDISYQQGSGMILNIFFGVAFNATMGITNQVKTAVASFTRSVQYAANPQIIKTFAAGDFVDFQSLFMRISRVSFLLMTFLGVPILLNTPYILNLWLTVLPPDGVTFVRLMIIFCIVDSFAGPLWVTMQAAGKIACYQIVVSLVWISCLPITYICYNYGMPAWTILIVLIAINAVLIGVRLLFTKRHCGVKLMSYVRGVLIPMALASVAAIIIPAYETAIIEPELTRLLVTGATWCVTMCVSTYFLGLTADERHGVVNFIKSKLP